MCRMFWHDICKTLDAKSHLYIWYVALICSEYILSERNWECDNTVTSFFDGSK